MPSWFVNVESIKDRLVANNEATKWVPDFVKEKRFHNWLLSARDWAVSRQRYWGTPIPIWHSEDWEEVLCVGSIEELYQLSGVRVDDLHREVVDEIVIPSQRDDQPPLRRVSEVFDCWFESGAMPMAQRHYPFEHGDANENGMLQADFIAEGLDQTRGWFYTLLVLSTALFDRPAFKNVVVNGLVLASDGKKMSKRLRNYPDPEVVINITGADALRFYLISSPVVRAEPLKFNDNDVRGVVRQVLLPWYNAYRFLVQSINRLSTLGEDVFTPPGPGEWVASSNEMDLWIQTAAAQLVCFVRQEMEAYRLYTIGPRLLVFMDDLTNWYVRMNRARLKGLRGREEALDSSAVLLQVLRTLTAVMAPLTPLMSEHVYLNLRSLLPPEQQCASIHHTPFPASNTSAASDEDLVQRVQAMQRVIVAGRAARDRRALALKVPLQSATVLVSTQIELEALTSLEHYIKSELNLRVLHVQTADRDDTKLEATADARVLGKRLGGKFKATAAAIKALDSESVRDLRERGELDVAGELILLREVHVARRFTGRTGAGLEAASIEDMSGALLLLDVKVDEACLLEAAARDLTSRLQKLKKRAGVAPSDVLTTWFQVPARFRLFVLVLCCHCLQTRSMVWHAFAVVNVLGSEDGRKTGAGRWPRRD